jgi:IS1 family transposase
MLDGFELLELQVDELCTFVGSKSNFAWVFTAIEVSSRLWPSLVTGRRSYKSAERLINDVIERSHFTDPPLITSDGFKYYRRLFLRLFRHACVYGQVMKTRRNNRVIKVERKRAICSQERLADALLRSEDSEKLNTSFIERLNLTIRGACAYLSRRTLSHARSLEQLVNDVALVQCWYNFLRPHRALRFGEETRTPAMQAGLVSRRLNWREVFRWKGVPCGHALARVIPFPVQQGWPSLRLAA